MRYTAEKTLKNLINQSDKLESNIADIFFFKEYVISEFKEGVHITYETSIPLIDAALDYYKDKPFGYISNRIYSYSLDPTDYFKLKRIENLKCFVVVSYNKITSNNATIEKLFFGKPFRKFDNLKEAIHWMSTIL